MRRGGRAVGTGLLWLRCQSGPTDSAQRHHGPSRPLRGNWEVCGSGKEGAILERTGRPGVTPPDPGRVAKPQMSGCEAMGRGGRGSEQESLRNQTHKYEAHGSSTKAPRQSSKGRETGENTDTNPFLTLCTNISSRWIVDLNNERQTRDHPEGLVGRNLCNLRAGRFSLERTPKGLAEEKTNDRLSFIKIQDFRSSRRG